MTVVGLVEERLTAGVLLSTVKAKITCPEAAAAEIGIALPVTTSTRRRSLRALRSPWARRSGARSGWQKAWWDRAVATALRLAWVGWKGVCFCDADLLSALKHGSEPAVPGGELQEVRGKVVIWEARDVSKLKR
eukprot:566667-Pelagomonas_calceolata.AAC.1